MSAPGRWHERSIESEALRGNPLRDTHVRPLFVWTPAGYETGHDHYPVIYVLHALTGQARAWFNVSAWSESLPDIVERLELEAIVVLVDGWTALGGSQWLDSPATGRYGTYFCDEVVAFVDEHFRTLPDAEHRALAGHSSGGYGAAVWTLRRPDLFSAFASHAGDGLFDVSLRPEFAPAAQALRNRYEGSFDLFWADFTSGRRVVSVSSDAVLQNVWACAAAYSPRPSGGVDVPFRLETGEIVPDIWERWIANDPVTLAKAHRESLRASRAIWIDAGRNDEYQLDLAAVALWEQVQAAGVDGARAHFELHEGGHRGATWRFAHSLPFLADRIRG